MNNLDKLLDDFWKYNNGIADNEMQYHLVASYKFDNRDETNKAFDLIAKRQLMKDRKQDYSKIDTDLLKILPSVNKELKLYYETFVGDDKNE